MGLEFVFRARVSSHGGGKYIIYIPKEFSERARELHGREVIVIVLTEG